MKTLAHCGESISGLFCSEFLIECRRWVACGAFSIPEGAAVDQTEWSRSKLFDKVPGLVGVVLEDGLGYLRSRCCECDGDRET
jgi:hypothetical protein